MSSNQIRDLKLLAPRFHRQIFFFLTGIHFNESQESATLATFGGESETSIHPARLDHL